MKKDGAEKSSRKGNFTRKPNSRFRREKENVKKGRLVVRNLSFKTTDEVLRDEFSKHGPITEVNILKKSDGKLVGCAFIQFGKYQDSLKAIKNMNGKMFLNRKIVVEIAVSKDRYKLSHPENIKVEIDNDAENIETKDEIKSEDEDDLPGSGSNSEDDNEDHDEVKEEDQSTEEIKKERKSNEEDHEFTVFVKNLSFDTSNEQLHECFKKFGPIKYALIVRDPVSGHSKGTGFVRFLKRESVNICLQQTGLVTLNNFTLEIFPSLSKEKIKSLETEKTKQEPKDGRNMYLLREGMVLAGSSAAEGVSATDMSKRLRLEQIKSQMLKNLNRFISRDRLTIHNLPEQYDDDKMRKMVIARTSTKPIECRVMRENQPSAAFPKGKPKGFGFLSFKKHEDALSVLRKVNNNPDVFSANHRPIVSFSIEDKNVLNIKTRREERSKLNNPTYQKKLEKTKLKKVKKKKDKMNKEKKPVATEITKAQEDEKEDDTNAFSGFAAKPGAFVKLRGTFRLREQSKIHEKSMHDRNKKVKREKLMAEIRKEKDERKLDKQSKKRNFDEGVQDGLAKMIDKYKNILRGDESSSKKSRTRGKWFIE